MRIIIKILRIILFYPLLWLRGILITIFRFISGIAFLCFIYTFINYYDGLMSINKPIVFASISFGFFLVSEVYDVILLKINPTNIIYILD